MKFFFLKTDSLYKIFKALEKIPSRRDVEIFIDPEHNLFDNERRWQQIKEIIDKNQIKAVFVTKNKKNREYYQAVWLNVNYEREKRVEQFMNKLYLFFFNIKNFHLHTYENKKYLFILIFVLEILLILWILWFVISLIIPSANIVIKPSESSETIIYNVRYYPNNDPHAEVETRFLYVPFYTWQIDYKHDLSISTANSKYITNPSHGKVKVYNKLSQEYVLVKNTKFVTEDGLIFLAENDFVLNPGSEEVPSETVIEVKANENDNAWELIGIRWNIKFKTPMLIQNLDESFLAKDIWAESIENFYWWESESVWSVTSGDIEQLKQKLIEQVYANKMAIVIENLPNTWWFVLPFDTITTTTFNDIEVEQSDGDNSPIIRWTAYVTYHYNYVMWEDIYQIFMTYVTERPFENSLIVKINSWTLQFLKNSDTTNNIEIKKTWRVFTIPTQVDVVQTYDFRSDPKQILSDIKDKIAWLDVDDARNYILSTYDEIWSVKISTPLWYRSIPIVKSRIKISYKEIND